MDRFWNESTWRRSSTRRLQFVLSLVVFRSCIKIDSVDMLKFTHTSSICLVFGLTGFGFRIDIYMVFMNRLNQNKFTWFNVY